MRAPTAMLVAAIVFLSFTVGLVIGQKLEERHHIRESWVQCLR